MPTDIISQKQLKKLYHYNPETGVFTWKVRNSNCINIGDIAGYKESNGYVRMRVNNKLYRAHQLAWLYMTGAWPTHQIDHIDRDKSNTQFSNLRDVSQSINMKNATIRSDNTSGVTGVHWYELFKKWRASLYVDGNRISLGYYFNKEDAISARINAEKKYGFLPD